MDGYIPNLWNFSGCSIGNKIISYNYFLTSSKPPISSHLTFGTSTTVSLKDEGLTYPIANLKCSYVTAIASKTAASNFSSSKSMTSIFSLIHYNALSVQSAAISAPTKPWVSLAIAARSTSSANFIFLVWILKISILPTSSGTPISISLSNLPNLLKAASMELGLFVAPITIT